MVNADDVVFWRWGEFVVNATVAYTWLVMALLTGVSYLVTRRLSASTRLTRWQNLLEVIVLSIRSQIREVSQQEPGPYLPFVGTLFLFIAACNVLAVMPGFTPPTASLSTTVALALCVLVAVPLFGVARQGVLRYLRTYLHPTPLMLPINVMGEISRTVALAVRLYGNMMSGTMVVAILIGIAPFFFPIVMQLFGLLTGLIQAYIFAILAMVYIAAATRAHPGEAHAGRDGETP